MTDKLMVVAILLTFIASMTRGNLFYRILGLSVTFSLMTILIFKDTNQVFLIIITGLVANTLLILSYKGYRTK